MSKYLKKLKKMSRNCRKMIVSCHKNILLFVTKKIKKLLKWVDFKHWMLGIKRVLKHVKTFMLLITVFTVSLSASQIHSVWLEAKVGNNTLYIQGLEGSGTAFHINTPSGRVYLITNNHVCEASGGLDYLMVFDKRNSQRLVPVKIIEKDSAADLCILQGLPGYSGLNLGKKAEISDKVYAFGYPKGQSMNISSGRVKAEAEIEIMIRMGFCVEGTGTTKFLAGFVPVCVASFKTIATDVAIFPGNSGGPLVNYFGNVVGVVSAADMDTHWGYAVRLIDLQKLISAY